MILDDDATAKIIGIEIDGDHQPRSERARRRDRQRIDQRAIHQPAAADPLRREDARQRIGCRHGVANPAACEPDFMPGTHLGRDCGEPQRQIRKGKVAEGLLNRRVNRWPLINPDPPSVKSR